MFARLLPLWVALFFIGFADTSRALGFIYNGFQSAKLNLDGIAEIENNGLMFLTNNSRYGTGHAFYPDPIEFKNSSTGEAYSFSTEFVFAITCPLAKFAADGLAFFIAPTKVLPGGRTFEFLGLFNASTNGSTANHVFGVELDTYVNKDTNDRDPNHAGIDINNINSIVQHPSGYYSSNQANGDGFKNFTIASGDPTRVWIDYDGTKKLITVTLAPQEVSVKPRIPLLSLDYDLSPILEQIMYVGFGASTGPVVTNHIIMGWSFATHGDVAQQLDLSKLPKIPRIVTKKTNRVLTIGVPVAISISIIAAVLTVLFYVKWKRKFAELLEDWEGEYGPHRFKYKDLYTATKGFRETELLGAGGFGSVYKGVLSKSKRQIAVKRISHGSKQGIREFVAEIVSIGRMSHRNLVPLLGYCRRSKNELMLVYEYMPNGSLDKFLYNPQQSILNWAQRFKIIKGVASGLFYLHGGWEQIVVHRDIKASNVLLDAELNGRLGDFGLAKLYDHGTDPQTTHIVGTVGYLAPEHYRAGRATTSTDVYAFGAFLLEVVCGKRPIQPWAPSSDHPILVNWVYNCWNEGRILDVVDKKLVGNFVRDEAELVLKLGLLCSNADPTGRPSIQKVMLHLDGSMPLPELTSLRISVNRITSAYVEGFDDVSKSTVSDPSSTGTATSLQYSRLVESVLSGGR